MDTRTRWVVAPFVLSISILGIAVGVGLVMPVEPLPLWVRYALLAYLLFFPYGFLAFVGKQNDEEPKTRRFLSLAFLISHWFAFTGLVVRLATAWT